MLPLRQDGFHEYIISGRGGAVNPARVGTKVAAHYVPRGARRRKQGRSPPSDGGQVKDAFGGFDEIFKPHCHADQILQSYCAESLNEMNGECRQALAECSGANSTTTSIWISI
jgi:hypothetical protein